MAEVDLKLAVGKIEQNSGAGAAETESMTEKVGAETVKARTEGLEGGRP